MSVETIVDEDDCMRMNDGQDLVAHGRNWADETGGMTMCGIVFVWSWNGHGQEWGHVPNRSAYPSPGPVTCMNCIVEGST